MMLSKGIPPQAKDAEVAVLGAILLEANALDRVADILIPDAFYVDAHKKIYSSILSLKSQGKPIDLITLVEQLKSAGTLDEVDGAYGVVRLTNAVVSSAHIESHARIIADKYMLRRLMSLGGELISAAQEPDADAHVLVESTEKQILTISTNASNTGVKPLTQVIFEVLERIEEWRKRESGITGVPSGFQKLDIATRGWQSGDLIIIAARPSVGKTAFALNLIMNAAKRDFKVAVWSLEMKAVYLALRMLSAESEIILHKLQTGRLSQDDMRTIMNACERLSKSGVFFDDGNQITLRTLKSKARRLVLKEGVKMIVIDYLQLMQGDASKGNREQEIATISRELKNLAQELNVPIIALSQLSREGVKNASWDVHPPISSLRESGAIEQDADLILMLWGANDTEISNDSSLENKRKIRILKQRNGMLLTLELDFQNEIQLFKAAETQNFQTF
jgi:replicative DNA helicase